MLQNPVKKGWQEATYRALVPVRYLQILILFTKTTDSEDSWKKNKNPREEEKKENKAEACIHPLCGQNHLKPQL